MCMPLGKYCIIYMGRKRAIYSVHVNKYMYIQYIVYSVDASEDFPFKYSAL